MLRERLLVEYVLQATAARLERRDQPCRNEVAVMTRDAERQLATLQNLMHNVHGNVTLLVAMNIFHNKPQLDQTEQHHMLRLHQLRQCFFRTYACQSSTHSVLLSKL